MMTGVSLCITTAKAQFNTVAVTPTRYKMEVLGMGLAQAEPAPESEISIQEVSTGIPVSADMDKKKWMDRYLSVSYPLRYIKVTSPYGYRKDPFTGKSKFHGGLDLRARGDEVIGHDGGGGREGRTGQDFRQVCNFAAWQVHRQLLSPL